MDNIVLAGFVAGFFDGFDEAVKSGENAEQDCIWLVW
jgi:hypothetical protein